MTTKSSSSSSSSSTKWCLVCNEVIEKFKGLHYGGQTCYSCRAFFRRCHSADRKTPFSSVCKNGGGCEISVKTRRKCPKCRHDKCIEVGMRPNLVLSQEEKKARFRKYYEKKMAAMKTGMSTPLRSGGRASNNRRQVMRVSEGDSGLDEDLDESSSLYSNPETEDSFEMQSTTTDSHTEATDRQIGTVSAEGPDIDLRLDEEQEQAVEASSLLEDPNLIELCMAEVDKILRDHPIGTTCATGTSNATNVNVMSNVSVMSEQMMDDFHMPHGGPQQQPPPPPSLMESREEQSLYPRQQPLVPHHNQHLNHQQQQPVFMNNDFFDFSSI